jgi:prevent-host-death family protein
MSYVNVHEAKTNLSRLLDAVESGAEAEIVIARNGKPVGKLVPMPKKRVSLLGIAKGEFVVPENIDEFNPEIEKLFYGELD